MKTLNAYIQVLFFVNFFNSPITAQELPWQRISPRYEILDILYDKENYLYYSATIDSVDYLFRSSNSGDLWEQIGNGLNGSRLYRLALDSTGVLWGGDNLSGKIFKSTDKGLSWIVVYDSGESILSINASPNGWIWAGTVGKIIYSSDYGENWIKRTIVSDYYDILSIASNSSNYIFAGLRWGGIYRSTDLGNSWEHVHWMGTIHSFVIDDSSYIYAIRSGFKIMSYDDGSTWVFVNDICSELETLYMDPNHNFWSGYNGFYGGVYYSTNLMHSWDDKGLNYVRPIAFIDSLVFAGTDHGLFRFDPATYSYVGDNYFPLNIGNKWQYFYEHSDGQKYVYVDSVANDTIIDNMKYFKIQGLKNDLARYSEQDKKLYIRYNDSDYIYMDYNLNVGVNYAQLNFYNHEIREVQAIEPGYVMFDNSYHFRGFFYTTGSLYFYSEIVKHAEGLGEVQYDDWWHGPVGTSGSVTRRLIRAIIINMDSIHYLSDQRKPAIAINPILITDEFNVDIIFKVNHAYSFYYQGILHDFTDSVLFYSYYANEDTVVNCDTTLILAEPNTVDYIVSLELDSTLMKNDYNFYYKIYAIDKGIVREHSFKPDNGYYELVYDPNPVSTELNNNSPCDYSLEQNYPNPFNPKTRINYSIKDEGLVILNIYDILGNKVCTLVNEKQVRGKYSVQFDATEFSSGIYFYQLRANKFYGTKKMVFLK